MMTIIVTSPTHAARAAPRRQGNYRGAINAYSRALELDGTLVACLSNRAACHYKLDEFFSCINDCTEALQMLGANKVKVESMAAEPEEVKVRRLGGGSCFDQSLHFR